MFCLCPVPGRRVLELFGSRSPTPHLVTRILSRNSDDNLRLRRPGQGNHNTGTAGWWQHGVLLSTVCMWRLSKIPEYKSR